MYTYEAAAVLVVEVAVYEVVVADEDGTLDFPLHRRISQWSPEETLVHRTYLLHSQL